MDKFLDYSDYSIAATNAGGRTYLLTNDEGKTGRVLDLVQKTLFPPFNFQSILSRGYWEKPGKETLKDIWVEDLKIIDK